jgi:riboflavin kinase
MQETTARDLGDAEVATLKHLALLGALEGEEKISCAGLGDRLEASTQTASRRLQHLEETDHLERDIVSDGQWVRLTDAGRRRLQSEYADYRRIFEDDAGVDLVGTVTSGMGEGRHYITLPGYMRQFRGKLDYEPFPGTLNVDLQEDSTRERARLGGLDPIVIEGWEDDERTYGPAYCYPATVSAGGERYEPAHVIAPERTHHDEDQLEVIAPDRLRDELALADDDEVRVHVTER